MAGYGGRPVIEDVSLEVKAGEIVALLGHNGAGKSTVLKAVFGLAFQIQGSVIWCGEPVSRRTPGFWIDAGLSYVQQGSSVFRDLTVGENLAVYGMARLRGRDLVGAIERTLEATPILQQKRTTRAGALSGGQQQLLALEAALLQSPKMMMLDEPSLGLASGTLQTKFDGLRRIASERKVGFLIVEQRVREVLAISDRTYVLRRGRVVFGGRTEQLSEGELRNVFLEQV